MCACHVSVDAQKQKRDLHPSDLDLKAVVSHLMLVLGTELWPSVKTSVFNYLVTLPTPIFSSFNSCILKPCMSVAYLVWTMVYY